MFTGLSFAPYVTFCWFKLWKMYYIFDGLWYKEYIIHFSFLSKLQIFQNGLSSRMSSKSVWIDEAVLAVDPIGPAHILPYPSCARDHVPGDFYYWGYVRMHRQTDSANRYLLCPHLWGISWRYFCIGKWMMNVTNSRRDWVSDVLKDTRDIIDLPHTDSHKRKKHSLIL